MFAVLCLVAQSCAALYDPMDCSPPGSSVHGDSPGKNTGVGCHFFLQGIFPTQVSVKNIYLVSNCVLDCCCCCLDTKSCSTLCYLMDCSWPGSSVHWDSPGKNTGVGCHFLLQGIFPTQGSNPHLLYWQADSLPLSHLGSPFGLFIIDKKVFLLTEVGIIEFPMRHSHKGTETFWRTMYVFLCHDFGCCD